MKTVLSLALAFSTLPVFPVMAATDLTYDDFKKSCLEENYLGQQRPPQKIKILCKNAMTSWQAIESGPLALEESRSINAELFSDKYHVSSADFQIATPEHVTTCPRFREVIQSVTLERALTCEQVKADDQDLKDLCLQVIDEEIAANSDLVEVKATGRTFSGCDNSVTQKP